MELEHSFTVPVGIERAWEVLTDVAQVAPCMPGAALDSVDGDDFTGTVKVKLGSIGLTYKGKASFVTKDVAARRAVIDARGKDARGNGTAAATVTATLHEAGAGTRVDVVTDLQITGKPAQFGRGVMVDVGNKLLGQFADCLAIKLAAPAAVPPASAPPESEPSIDAATATATSMASAAPTEPAPSAPVPTERAPAAPSRESSTEPEPIDLMKVAGPALLKRFAPLVAALVLLVVLLRRRKRRHS